MCLFAYVCVSRCLFLSCLNNLHAFRTGHTQKWFIPFSVLISQMWFTWNEIFAFWIVAHASKLFECTRTSIYHRPHCQSASNASIWKHLLALGNWSHCFDNNENTCMRISVQISSTGMNGFSCSLQSASKHDNTACECYYFTLEEERRSSIKFDWVRWCTFSNWICKLRRFFFCSRQPCKMVQRHLIWMVHKTTSELKGRLIRLESEN